MWFYRVTQADYLLPWFMNIKSEDDLITKKTIYKVHFKTPRFP